MSDPLFARQRQIVGTTGEWAADDLVLGAGELALERQGDGSVFARVGDGSTPFSDAPYLTTQVAAVRYIGNADPTQPPPAGAVPGDAYTASPGGVVDASWGPPAAGMTVDEGDFLVMGADGSWNVQSGGIDSSTFVTEPELAAPTGGAMVGLRNGSNLQDFFDPGTGAILALGGDESVPGFSFLADRNTGLYHPAADQIGFTVGGIGIARLTSLGLVIGDVTGISRLDILTSAADLVRGLDIHHKANQGAVSNQYPAFSVHSYVNAFAGYFDNVGDMGGVVFRQASNPAARPDKPVGYVGTGPFWRCERAIPGDPGSGGNLGTGNNLLAECDQAGCFNARGSNAADWAGSDGNAPLKLAGFSNYLTRLYGGFNSGLGKGVIGVINSGVAFLPLQLAVSSIDLNTDNVVPLASAAQRLKEINCANGTIITSDEREKVWRGGPSEAELRAARRISAELGFFQWKAAIGEKGDAARYHFGPRAQRVWKIMADEKLIDPLDKKGLPQGACPYAFLCFDQWDEERVPVMVEVEVDRDITFDAPGAVIDPKTGRPAMRKKTAKGPVRETRQKVDRHGKPVFETVLAAGNRFGVRPDELNAFLIAALDARLAALEEKATH